FRAATFFAAICGRARGAHHRLSSRTASGVPEAQPIALAIVDSEVAAMAWSCRYAGGGVGHDCVVPNSRGWVMARACWRGGHGGSARRSRALHRLPSALHPVVAFSIPRRFSPLFLYSAWD